MCQVCALIIKRLVHKGLVSKGNVAMCEEEIATEMAQAMTQMSTEELRSLAKDPHANVKDWN